MTEFLNKAIMAHSAWKGRLRKAVDGGELPDATSVRADNQCDLGKWIYGDGKSHQSLPEFQELKSQHAHFHKAAADVVEMIKKGDKAKAHADLESGVFAGVSVKVVNAITNLRHKIE
jgi:methyl-accepting chemotaxis protein